MRPVLLLCCASLALVALLLLTTCAERELTSADSGDDQLQILFLKDMLADNQRLRLENEELRRTLLTYEATLTAQNETLKNYFERLRLEAQQPREIPHPYDRIPPQDIKVYGSNVLIRVAGVTPVSLADTNSMDPLADSSSTILAVVPKDESEIHVGDILGYRCSRCSKDEVILHRVIAVNEDGNGTYYTLKGDNNALPDTDKVRFGQVTTVVVGIIY